MDLLNNPEFGYTLDLGTAFAAVGGTEYWISIVPDVNRLPQWLWETSSQGDNNNYQCYFGACGNDTHDLAFVLWTQQQSQVPEPGSLILMGTGMLGLAGSLRRKLLG